MIERPARLVRFVSADAQDLPGDRSRAHVELRGEAGQTYAATIDGDRVEAEMLRSIAQATGDALCQAVGGTPNRLQIEGVSVSDVFGKRTVFVAVSARFEREIRDLLGCCVMGGDPVRAVALAVLNATNRFLGVG